MKEEIIETFSLLHDGFIESIVGNESELRICISINFLVNNIKQNFTTLTVVVYDITELEYIDWSDSKTVYFDLETIISIAKEIWITQCDFNIDGRIAIHGHGGNSCDETSCGGSLLFNSEKCRIIDSGGNELSLSQLKPCSA